MVRVYVVGVHYQRLGLLVVLRDPVPLRDDEIDRFPQRLLKLELFFLRVVFLLEFLQLGLIGIYQLRLLSETIYRAVQLKNLLVFLPQLLLQLLNFLGLSVLSVHRVRFAVFEEGQSVRVEYQVRLVAVGTDFLHCQKINVENSEVDITLFICSE